MEYAKRKNLGLSGNYRGKIQKQIPRTRQKRELNRHKIEKT